MFLETNPHKSDYSQYFTNFAAVHLITLRLKSDKYIANSFRAIIGILVVLFAYSCANIGTPNGGPYDELPPKFISSVPTPNTVNYKGKKVEILFDELIQIEKASENVIITPHASFYSEESLQSLQLQSVANLVANLEVAK